MTISRWKNVPATLEIEVGLVDGEWIDGRDDRAIPASLGILLSKVVGDMEVPQDAVIELHLLASGSSGIDPADCDSTKWIDYVYVRYAGDIVKVIKDSKVIDDCREHWAERIEDFEFDFDEEYDG